MSKALIFNIQPKTAALKEETYEFKIKVFLNCLNLNLFSKVLSKEKNMQLLQNSMLVTCIGYNFENDCMK